MGRIRECREVDLVWPTRDQPADSGRAGDVADGGVEHFESGAKRRELIGKCWRHKFKQLNKFMSISWIEFSQKFIVFKFSEQIILRRFFHFASTEYLVKY